MNDRSTVTHTMCVFLCHLSDWLTVSLRNVYILCPEVMLWLIPALVLRNNWTKSTHVFHSFQNAGVSNRLKVSQIGHKWIKTGISVLKSDLKKPRICPIWGQADSLWSQTYHPWERYRINIYSISTFLVSVSVTWPPADQRVSHRGDCFLGLTRRSTLADDSLQHKHLVTQPRATGHGWQVWKQSGQIGPKWDKYWTF